MSEVIHSLKPSQSVERPRVRPSVSLPELTDTVLFAGIGTVAGGLLGSVIGGATGGAMGILVVGPLGSALGGALGGGVGHLLSRTFSEPEQK